jgi:glucuronate isomerase
MSNDIFITDDFLLLTDAARELYHDYAAKMPVIDYHCHLPPQQVADDHVFENMTQIWLYGDHYKWRQMRTAGVEERFCTGHASDWEKFAKWAEVVPMTLRNPLYHWTHLELKHPFGISDRMLNPETAKGIYDECNAKLVTPEFSARGIMKQMDVVLVCTTDDPTDTLEHHMVVKDDASFDVQMLPTWRPDKAMAVECVATFNAYVDKLAAVADVEINGLAALMTALRKRHDFFHEIGCRLSDHGIEQFYAADCTEAEATAVFAKIRSGRKLTENEIEEFKSYMMHEFAIMDYEKGWTQQIHYGCMRNNNTRMFKQLGADTGFDSIADFSTGQAMSRFFDKLEQKDQLAKTIIYSLNPGDNELIASMLGNFQGEGIRGKLQFGSGWWFLDQLDGMEKQMEALSNLGLLSCFVGMLTDSRSFLSYTRHEYFRRLLCNILGRDIESGLLPRDMKLLGKMVQDISYNNAANYFGFNL